MQKVIAMNQSKKDVLILTAKLLAIGAVIGITVSMIIY